MDDIILYGGTVDNMPIENMHEMLMESCGIPKKHLKSPADQFNSENSELSPKSEPAFRLAGLQPNAWEW